MSKADSIAEARNQLSRVVHEAENTGEVQLTRRGKPVAVVLSMDEYRRLNGSTRESVWSVIEQAHAGLQNTAGDNSEFNGLRSEDSGRDFQW